MTDETPTVVGGRVPPGKKRCPNCAALLGVRTLACACGHAFTPKPKPEGGAARTPRAKGEAGEGDLLARARHTRDAVADFCERYSDLAEVTARLAVVQELRGKLTLDEHREIEHLAAATGGLDLLALVVREIMRARAQSAPETPAHETGAGKFTPF